MATSPSQAVTVKIEYVDPDSNTIHKFEAIFEQEKEYDIFDASDAYLGGAVPESVWAGDISIEDAQIVTEAIIRAQWSESYQCLWIKSSPIDKVMTAKWLLRVQGGEDISIGGFFRQCTLLKSSSEGNERYLLIRVREELSISYEEQYDDVLTCLADLLEFRPALEAFFYEMRRKMDDEGLEFGEAWNEVTDVAHLGDAIADWREQELIPRLCYEPESDPLDDALEVFILENGQEGQEYLDYFRENGSWPIQNEYGQVAWRSFLTIDSLVSWIHLSSNREESYARLKEACENELFGLNLAIAREALSRTGFDP